MKKIILRVLNKLKLLKFLNFTYRIKLNQNEIIIPIQGGVGFNNLHAFELWMIDILKFLDYLIYRIEKDRKNQLASLALIESIGIHSNLECCDYIFSPQELKL